MITCCKIFQCWKTWDVCSALLLINSHLSLKKIAKLANFTTFHKFFWNWILNYCQQNALLLFVIIAFETILGLDSGNTSSKSNSESYMNIGVPENQRNLLTRNFLTIYKTFSSHKVRLNWAIKLKFSRSTCLIEAIKWQKFEED